MGFFIVRAGRLGREKGPPRVEIEAEPSHAGLRFGSTRREIPTAVDARGSLERPARPFPQAFDGGTIAWFITVLR